METTPNKQVKIDEIARAMANYLDSHDWGDYFDAWIGKIKAMGDNVAAQIFDKFLKNLAKLKDVEHIFEYACKVKTGKTDIMKILNPLIDAGNNRYISAYLQQVKDNLAQQAITHIPAEDGRKLVIKIAQTRDAECIYNLLFVMHLIDFNSEERKVIRTNLVDRLIETGKAELMLKLAEEIDQMTPAISKGEKDNIISALVDGIIKTDDDRNISAAYKYNPSKVYNKLIEKNNVPSIAACLKYNYKYIVGEKRDKMEELLFNSKSPALIYSVAEEAIAVEGHALPRYEDAIIATRRTKLIMDYAETLPVSDKVKFAVALAEIGSDYAVEFASRHTKLIECMIEPLKFNGDGTRLAMLVKYADEGTKDKLVSVLLKIGKDEDLIVAIKNCQSHSINQGRLVKEIIKRRNPKSIVACAKALPFCLEFLSKLEDAVIEIKDIKALNELYHSVPNTNKHKLGRAYKEIKGKEPSLGDLMDDLKSKKSL